MSPAVSVACRCPACQCQRFTPHPSRICFMCRPGEWPASYDLTTRTLVPNPATPAHYRKPRTRYINAEEPA